MCEDVYNFANRVSIFKEFNWRLQSCDICNFVMCAGLLARLAGLRQPALCVEPVQAMLDRAEVNKIANIQVRTSPWSS